MKKYFVFFGFLLSVGSVLGKDKNDTIIVDRSMFETPQLEYPKQIVARPLTLKQSMFEVQLAPGIAANFQLGTTLVGELNAGLKYGITDNVQVGLSSNIFTGFTNSIIAPYFKDGYIGTWFNSIEGKLAYQFYNDDSLRLMGSGSYLHSEIGGFGQAGLTGKYTIEPVAGQLNVSIISFNILSINPELILQLGSSFSIGAGILYLSLLDDTSSNSLSFTSQAALNLGKNFDARIVVQPMNTQVALELSWRI